MVQNQILLKRICQLIAQTYAVPLQQIWEDVSKYGVEDVIQKIEESEQNSPNFN